MAIFAQGCHELVPPDEVYVVDFVSGNFHYCEGFSTLRFGVQLRPVVRCLMDQFVAEYQTPEAMAVGLHAVGMCRVGVSVSAMLVCYR